MTQESVDEPGAEETSGDVVDHLEAAVEETERIHTGISSVDSVVDDVAKLVGRPVEEHAVVFESAHDRLRRTLDDPHPDSEPGPELEPDREP